MTPPPSAPRRRFARYAWLLVVLVFLVVAFVFLQSVVHEQRYSYYGCSTGLTRCELSRLGFVYKRAIQQTSLSQAIEKYLGSQPAETHWELMLIRSKSTPGDSLLGCYFIALISGNELAMLIESDPALRDQFGPIRCDMQIEAKRRCLEEFIRAQERNHGWEQCSEYEKALLRAVRFLDRPVEVSDIPTAAEVADKKVWQSVWEPRIAQAYQQWLKIFPSGTQPGLEDTE
jgi:hypothetical protein